MYEKTTFAGRFQAHSPYYEAQSLDSRRGRTFDSNTQLVRYDKLIEPDYTTVDTSGFTVSTDDEADDYSGNGADDTGD